MSSSIFCIVDEQEHYLGRVREQLDACMGFWLKHSHDKKNGGFFTCLTGDGRLVDDSKHSWMQARQVWTYAELYRHLGRFRKEEELLAAAASGGEFLRSKLKDPKTGRVFLSATAAGEPTDLQRTPMAEIFYAQAMAGLYRATKEEKWKAEALEMLGRVLHWVRVDDSELGRVELAGHRPAQSLDVMAALMCMLQQMFKVAENEMLSEAREWTVARIKLHAVGGKVLDLVDRETGARLPGAAGRRSTPGLALKAGWALLSEAKRLDDQELGRFAAYSFVEAAMESGRDRDFGGLFYHTDVEGFPPLELEWDMKLWWVHCEALVACLLAYKFTNNPKHWERFREVADYCKKHFVDESEGEWFGYLHRDGTVSADLKGGPWKGCYHVPRALLICEKLLDKEVGRQHDKHLDPHSVPEYEELDESEPW